MQVQRISALLLLLVPFGLTHGDAALAKDEALPAELLTVAERSGFTATSRSAEVDALTTLLCKRSKHLRGFEFGRTVEGKRMGCVIAADPMVTTPADLKDDPRLVVLVIGNIHSGECAGKEALLMLLREIALHERHPWLSNAVVLIAPNYNADGNDKFGPNAKNRRNQDGPKEMGTRANAMGLDLNRDFMKLESPEGRSLVGLMRAWNPHLFIDCHTTNGSWHRYPLTYDVPHGPASPASVRSLLRDRMLPAVATTLEKAGTSTFYYGNFSKDHTQWTTYGYEPRYSTEYVGLCGRLAILAEAYSYIPYKDRIFATKAFVEACVDWVRAHPEDVKRAVVAAPGGPKAVPLRAKVEAFEEAYVLKGYSPATLPKKPPEGAKATKRVKPTVPKDYSVEFWGRYTPAKVVARPYAYVLPVALSAIVPRLQRHGISVERITKEHAAAVEVSRFTSIVKPRVPFQGHEMVTVLVERRTEARTLAVGDFLVRTAGPLAALTMHLLEPEAPDSLLTWNAFDDHLKVGGDYPVLRLLPATKLATEPVSTKAPAPR